MKKKIILAVMLLVLVISLSACSGNEYDSIVEKQNANNEDTHIFEENVEQSSQVPDDNFEKEETPSLPEGQEVENSGISNAEEVKGTGYSILTYTEVPNKNSSISIQYPFFEEEGNKTLNNLIFEKVQELAQIDASLFPEDSDLTIDYQAEITLQNAKIVSIVFWGTSSVSGGAYETNDIIPLNIDIQTMEEISFEDLYIANDDFQKVFFEKAYFPTSPVTSYEEGSFAEMLKLQSPEYQSISPFSIQGNVRCFLKPDALVLSMPSVHAAGSDHFEAQINYDDIQGFYLPEQKYWIETDISEEVTISAGESQQDAKSMDSVEKKMLLYGNCDALGCGWLIYTVPDQEDQDYKIYFFADKSKNGEEMDFNLDQADFIFPDVRENNKAIGKFIDLYLYEPFTTESGESAWIAVATYETGGRQYYDTRIYTLSEEGYVVDKSMTEELNDLYSDVEEYPVSQIIEMPHD